MNIINIIAQLFGLGAFINLILSYQRSSKKKLLLSQVFSAVFYAIQYLLLKAYTACAQSILSCLRTLTFYKYVKNNKKIPIYYLIIFETLIIMFGIYTYESYLSIIPTFISMMYAYMTYKGNLKQICYAGAFTAVLWIYYNFMVGAYVSSIASVVEFISSISRGIRLSNNKGKTEQK